MEPKCTAERYSLRTMCNAERRLQPPQRMVQVQRGSAWTGREVQGGSEMGRRSRNLTRDTAIVAVMIAAVGCTHAAPSGTGEAPAYRQRDTPSSALTPTEPGLAKPVPSGRGSVEPAPSGRGTVEPPVPGSTGPGGQGDPSGGSSPSYGGDPINPVTPPPVDHSAPPADGGGLDPSGGTDGGNGHDPGGSEPGNDEEPTGETCPPPEDSLSPSPGPAGSATPSSSPDTGPPPHETCPHPSST